MDNLSIKRLDTMANDVDPTYNIYEWIKLVRVLQKECDSLRDLVAQHSCNYKRGHPLATEPCVLCKIKGKIHED